MQMRLTWPIDEPPRGLHQLVDIAVDDIDELVAEQGYAVAGIPEQWDVWLGARTPGWEDHRLVLTCVVPVSPRVDAALEGAA